MKKPRKCRNCGERFEPQYNTTQSVCGIKCAFEYGRNQAEKQKTKEKRERKRRLLDTDRAHWIEKAQKAFNAWIRGRDAGVPCISCGCPDGKGKRNAGHYRPAGVNTALRFDPDNVHGQCERCNTSYSGNLSQYRIGLVKKIGSSAVERLDNDHKTHRWDIDELKSIHEAYSQAVKLGIFHDIPYRTRCENNGTETGDRK